LKVPNIMTTASNIFAIFLSTCLLIGVASTAQAQVKTSPSADAVFIVQPVDRAVVTSPFKVKFGLHGKKIGPIGDLDPSLGHHHLIIELGSVEKNQSIPFSDKHMHFGGGQTETELSLPPGRYQLTLQFGNGAHQSYGREMSHTIHIEVRASHPAPVALPASAW
jgi:Domain of unknown function (DUF4399)